MGDEGGFFLEAGYDSYQWWTRNFIISNIWGVLSDMEGLVGHIIGRSTSLLFDSDLVIRTAV